VTLFGNIQISGDQMRPINRAASILSLFGAVLCTMSLSPVLSGQKPPGNDAPKDLIPTLIEQMPGSWDVQQRMWPASGTQGTDLPAGVAHRRLIGGAFLEEVMEMAPKSKGEPFTRIAYFNYNGVNQQYEYFSVDTRAPQMMNERSYGANVESKMPGDGAITLYGGIFVAPRWGEAKNAAFSYRLTVSEIRNDRQVVRLYLVPLSGKGGKEFLAFEYVYTRRR
jgi:Protein of unknown function (DUF1579)